MGDDMTIKTSDEIRTERSRTLTCDHLMRFACPWPKTGVNLGTLLRTADALGMCLHVNGGSNAVKYLRRGNTVGYEHVCWSPTVDWSQMPRPWVAVELAHSSVPLAELPSYRTGTVILGHENKGIPDEILDDCDYVVEIPMQGVGNSLNVAVAGSLVGYKLRGWV